MSKLVWDKSGEHYYETGVDHGVLYPLSAEGYNKGVAWNGITSVTESPSGAESNPQYADNIKYLDLISAEEFGATIEAFTYPPEFEACDGYASPVPGVTLGQQGRQKFGLCYRTKIGNDTVGQDMGYKLHLIYGASATPSDRNYQTINESPEAISFSWEISTTPVEVDGFKPTASMTIDSRLVDAVKLKELEDILFGTDEGDMGEDKEPRLPMPSEVIAILSKN